MLSGQLHVGGGLARRVVQKVKSHFKAFKLILTPFFLCEHWQFSQKNNKKKIQTKPKTIHHCQTSRKDLMNKEMEVGYLQTVSFQLTQFCKVNLKSRNYLCLSEEHMFWQLNSPWKVLVPGFVCGIVSAPSLPTVTRLLLDGG